MRPVFGALSLDAQKLFVMGDNRDNSQDSRFTGPVDAADVVGRAAIIWFSFTPEEGIRWHRMG
ncbi:MAG: signal peptidase I, partial [Archangium sp.]|nr:signal peptidase I [Archangium sp.]